MRLNPSACITVALFASVPAHAFLGRRPASHAKRDDQPDELDIDVLTNGKRMAMGLPPRAPTPRREISKPRPSGVPFSKLCTIKIVSAVTNETLGYVGKDLQSADGSSSDTDGTSPSAEYPGAFTVVKPEQRAATDCALKASFSYTSPSSSANSAAPSGLSLTLANFAESSTWPYLGAANSKFSSSDVFSADESGDLGNYVVLAPTVAKGKRPHADRSPYAGASERMVWRYESWTGQLNVTWTNANHDSIPLYAAYDDSFGPNVFLAAHLDPWLNGAAPGTGAMQQGKQQPAQLFCEEEAN